MESKKSLKIPKRQSESVYRRTDNTMAYSMVFWNVPTVWYFWNVPTVWYFFYILLLQMYTGAYLVL
jgi:hypothetical protein